MSTQIEKLNNDEEAICALVCNGDAARLTPDQKTQYYLMRCKSAGLDPRAQPFQFMTLDGKLVLYALKSCSDQLSAIHGINVEVTKQETTEDGIRIVTVRATTKDNKQTDEIGCVATKGVRRWNKALNKNEYIDLKGDDLANAFMKCVTKAKRRAILSVCGLGSTDESEIETIEGAELVAEAPKNPSGMKEPRAKKSGGSPVTESSRATASVSTGDAVKNTSPAAEIPKEELKKAELFQQAINATNVSVTPLHPSEVKTAESLVKRADELANADTGEAIDAPEEPLDELTINNIVEKVSGKDGSKTWFVYGSDGNVYYTRKEEWFNMATLRHSEGRGAIITAGDPTERDGKKWWPIISVS